MGSSGCFQTTSKTRRKWCPRFIVQNHKGCPRFLNYFKNQTLVLPEVHSSKTKEVPEILQTISKTKHKRFLRFFQTTSKTRQKWSPRYIVKKRGTLDPENYFKNQTQQVPYILSNCFKYKTRDPQDSFKVLQKPDTRSPHDSFKILQIQNTRCPRDSQFRNTRRVRDF